MPKPTTQGTTHRITALAGLAGTILLAVAFLYYLQTAEPLILFAGILAAITLPLAAWVHQDARTRNLPSIPWTLVALLLPILGTAAYLITREIRPDPR